MSVDDAKLFLDQILEFTKGQEFTSVIDVYSFLVEHGLVEDKLKFHEPTKRMYLDSSKAHKVIRFFKSLDLIEYTDEDFEDFKKKVLDSETSLGKILP